MVRGLDVDLRRLEERLERLSIGGDPGVRHLAMHRAYRAELSRPILSTGSM
jgi:hypothetical protein